MYSLFLFHCRCFLSAAGASGLIKTSYFMNNSLMNFKNAAEVNAGSFSLRLKILRLVHLIAFRFRIGRSSKILTVVRPRCNGLKRRVNLHAVYTLCTTRTHGLRIVRAPTSAQICFNGFEIRRRRHCMSSHKTLKVSVACHKILPSRSAL